MHKMDAKSLSARRAWIEIRMPASLPGSCTVALRKESVDRNERWVSHRGIFAVALRKESVDRNCDSDPVTDKAWASLSARRAWIEIIFSR